MSTETNTSGTSSGGGSGAAEDVFGDDPSSNSSPMSAKSKMALKNIKQFLYRPNPLPRKSTFLRKKPFKELQGNYGK
jgi:hypothetical protein